MVDKQARIFANERLHQLQVRYPWAGGYAVAPIFFAIGRRYADGGGLTWFSRLPTLLSFLQPGAAGRLAAVTQAGIAQSCWYVHFLRRLWEVFFVNDYSGNFQRDSRGELLYYSMWGWIAGAAVGTAPLQLHGPSSPLCAVVGVAAFAIGELGNYWCHAELRRLRAESAGGLAGGVERTGQYVIPSRGPFRYVCCPHYTFELLSWVGYAALNGGDATSAFLLVLAALAMGGFARDRHAKYVRLFQEGQRDGGDPSRRWKMVPLLW